MNQVVSEADARTWLRLVGVSRETEAQVDRYVALLQRWNATVNLVAPASLHEIWPRHIIDSAQLLTIAPANGTHWLDLGSGAGLPGLVCAILAADIMPDTRFTLVESDKRKSAFLSTCLRDMGLPATLLTGRIETVAPQAADIISARALATLPRLFGLSARHSTSYTVHLYPKGYRYAAEIEAARADWSFTVDALPSITDPSARILRCRLQAADHGGRSGS